ncbi:MAG: hypothetical protein AVDCRST_MAG30-4571, partial [uncultured Solirubrobacteraceae bacterium]
MARSRLARSLPWPLLGVALAALALTATPPVAAAQGDDRCLSADLPPVDAPARPLRFGITPGAAGTAGPSQGAVAPENRTAAIAALQGLESPKRELVLRLNRLFWADGDEGIRRFAAMADEYGRAGLASEIQVRYHPPEGAEGDIDRWEGFVRRAVRELGPRPAVAGFSITNEANFPVSPNTSDGAYDGVIDALVRGVAVAHEELVKLGRPDLPVGFNVAWRYTPDSDARFWTEIGRKATPAFRRGLGYVGLQVYPGLVWPPAERPGVTAGEETVEALTLIRRCYMPKAGLGGDVDLWVSENGYATNQGRPEPRQAEQLDSTVRDVHRWSGTLGVTDYRYFNLRDNDSDGDDLFDAVGLLRDDYKPKPAYAVLGGLIGQLGREAGAAPIAPAGPGSRGRRVRPRVDFRVLPRADLRGRRRFAVRGRLLLPPAV